MTSPPFDIDKLGRVLAIANRSPKFVDSERFYAIKQYLLDLYGSPIGHEIQRIQKECWSCGGTGVYGINDCDRCVGGIYQTRYYRLRAFQFGRQKFHTPIESVQWREAHAIGIKIEGKIQKTPSRSQATAHAVLGRLFLSGYYWDAIGRRDHSAFGRCVRRSDQITRSIMWGYPREIADKLPVFTDFGLVCR